MNIVSEWLINTIYTIALIAALAFVCWLHSSVLKSRKKELDDSLFEKVAWCVTEDGNRKYRSFDELIVYVYNFQSRNIEQEYRILEDQEIAIAKEILEHFRKDLSRNYFNKVLVINKEISRFTNEEYFMFSLCAFLRKNECETEFNRNEKFKHVSHEPYMGGTLTLYELTDYGRSYMKLLYIAARYCENSTQINKTKIYKCDDVRRILDSNQITISCYRH